MAAGHRTNSPHGHWTERRYRAGEPVTFELAGHRHHYAAGLARTVHLGDPPDSYRAPEDTVHEGMATALTTLRAGYRAEQVKHAWDRATTTRGVVKADRIGHSIGLSFPDTCWVDRTASLASGDHTVLAPGMRVHLMLAVHRDEVGYSLSETFVVTEGDPEPLSSLPRELLVRRSQ